MNQELWNLGNSVVRLRQKIDSMPPIPLTFTDHQKLLSELLDLINNVRMACMDGDKKEWNLTLYCTGKEISEISKAVHDLGISFDIEVP